MHFFNPAHKMKLVELIRGLETTDETVETARAVAEKMGKETVEVNEFPGFVTSRINCLVGNEAMNMLVEGVASAADIDKALKLGLGYPMGPLERRAHSTSTLQAYLSSQTIISSGKQSIRKKSRSLEVCRRHP